MKSQLLLICLAGLFPALCTADWIPTGSLTAAREGHTAVLLADGRLMVIGGTAAITTAYSFAHDGRTEKQRGTLRSGSARLDSHRFASSAAPRLHRYAA